MAAIKQFDQASGRMVAQGNRINKWVLAFTVIAVLLATMDAIPSAWGRFFWWMGHGFLFR